MQLTDVLAMYGAGPSKFTAVWNYDRTRAQVRLLPVFAFETIEGESVRGIRISVQNVSSQSVHIANVSLLYPFVKSTTRSKLTRLIHSRRIPRNDGWRHSNLFLHGIKAGCPAAIEPGQSLSIFVSDEVLEKAIQNATSPSLKAVAQDAL
jgi:hypothetical protein